MPKVKSRVEGQGGKGHKAGCDCRVCQPGLYQWVKKPEQPAQSGQELKNQTAPPELDKVKPINPAGGQPGAQSMPRDTASADEPAPSADKSAESLLQELRNLSAPAGEQTGAQPVQPGQTEPPPQTDQAVAVKSVAVNELGMTPEEFDKALNYAAKDLLNGPYIAIYLVFQLKGIALPDFKLSPDKEKEFVERLVAICKRYGWTWLLRVQYIDVIFFVIGYVGNVYADLRTALAKYGKEVEDVEDESPDVPDGADGPETADKTASSDKPATV